MPIRAMAAMFSTRGAFVISFLLVALCYVNSLPNDFVFDDGPIVSSNPVIRAITPIQFLKSPYWTKQQYAGIYRPFVIFSLSADYAIWKRWAPGFRLTNLAVHAINGVLVFLLCQSFGGAGIVPLIAMIIYLVHPVHTEAVTTIVGRSELFAACFFLAAWLLFRRGRTAWAAVAFLLALLSKENTIVLPAILLLTSPRGRRWIRLLPMIFVALAYLALRYSVLGGLGIPVSAQYMGGRLTYFERLLTSGRVFLQYLILIFYPVHLAGDYDYNAIPIANFVDWDAWLGLLLIAATVVTAYFYRHRNWAVSLGLSFALIAFIPASNWIMPISILMAERFLYLPFIGLALVGATAVSQLEDRRLRRLVVIGALCMAICYLKEGRVSEAESMYRQAAQNIPNPDAMLYFMWGVSLENSGQSTDAIAAYERAALIEPENRFFQQKIDALRKTISRQDYR